MNEIVNTTLDKELSSFLELDYIPKEIRKEFWNLISTFIKIPHPSNSDIKCVLDAFGLVEDITLLGIIDNAKQIEAKRQIGLLKSTFLIDAYRSREGFTRTLQTTTLN